MSLIGTQLVKQLVATGNRVCALLLEDAIRPWTASISANLAIQREIDFSPLGKIDVIIHLAGKAHALSEIGEGEEYFL